MVGVSITPTGPTTLMFGLEDAPADFTDLYPPVRLTYGLQLRADGTLVVMEANRAVSNTLIFYSAGDVLSVRFDAAAGTAGAVEYAIGDLVFFTTAAASFGNAPKKAGLILANGAGLASGAYALLGAPVCTNAGNCSTLFRRPCFDADTCGTCMPGRSGDPCVTNEAAVGSLATWALRRGATDASGVITPHAESTWGNSGMVSAEGIVAGGAATGIEFGTDSTTGSVMVGLTRALSVSGYASYFALDFAFYLRADSLVGIYESGSSIFTGSELYTVNDKFTIRLATQGSKTVVQYAVNGIVVYTSAKAPVFPLMAGVSFGSRTAKVKSIRWDAAGSCSAAPASCGSLNRGPCFDDDLCAPCFAAFRATDNAETSKPAVSTCDLQTAAAGAITWRRESHITRTATPSIRANAGAFWGRTGMVSDEGFIPGQSSTATGVSFKPLRVGEATKKK